MRCRFMCSFCTRLIDSSPPATTIGTRSTITRCAASAMACMPEEQKRLTVMPAVVTGSPARSAAWRAMFWPVAPSGSAQPMTTSSTSPGSRPARLTACAMTWPPTAAPCVLLKAPRYARPIGVRAVETMTASAMGLSLCASDDGDIIPGAMGVRFFAALVVDGALAGALYALVALSFVVVYRASRMMNFAVGEWVMLASRCVTFALHGLGLGLPGALAVGCAGMAGFGVAFNRVVLRRLVGQPVISVIMVTIGLGALVRGAAALAFGGVPAGISLPALADPIVIGGVAIGADKLVAAVIAAACTAGVAWLLHGSRTGVALRAIADDQQAAMSAGIDLHRHFAITWALVGVVSVLAGTLWTLVAGGGLGMVHAGLKVFPIVIIGGLDSIAGTIIGALAVGMLESLAAGYLDPPLGGGFSNIASYLVLLAALFVRPYGLFGRPDVQRGDRGHTRLTCTHT